ncbi:MAG: hypothetical protein MH321_03100 [Leptospiraceae bacterium]|nr:hypothetical protein [Leptospiraceae bacterium]
MLKKISKAPKTLRILFYFSFILFVIGSIIYGIQLLLKSSFTSQIQCISGDCKAGLGRIIFLNGEVYAGRLKDKLPHGKGHIQFSNRGFYKGEWKEGKIDGYGIYQYPDSTKFIGQFRKNKREGWGKLEIGDYSLEGMWSSDSLNGQGILTDPERKMKGIYERGILVQGIGIIIYPNGTRYVGEGLMGKRNGLGRVESSEGKLLEVGEWKDDTKIK